MKARTRSAVIAVVAGVAACQPERDPTFQLTPDDILDPESCRSCHPTHVEQWESSMHAYAAKDPVFVALNQRGQRETDGALGDACVQCHAPVALAAGLTTDGTNLADLPDHLGGVTCAWCHRVDAVTGDHNAALSVDADSVLLRGGIYDPTPNLAHDAAGSPLHDRNDPASSSLCGSCHDVVLPNGFHLERTYAEWRGSVFAGSGLARQSCGHCHMPRSAGKAAVDGPDRDVHDHLMPAVDVALIDFPGRAENEAAVQAALDHALLPTLCVQPAPAGSEVVVTLENLAAGHRFPSGATHDRRVWVEVVATNADGEVLLDAGRADPDRPLADQPDPLRGELHDVASDAAGDTTHLFWEVESLTQRTLPVASTNDPSQPGFVHSETRRWAVPGAVPARVELRVWFRPFGPELFDTLHASGDLDVNALDPVPTFELRGATRVWEGNLGDCL